MTEIVYYLAGLDNPRIECPTDFIHIFEKKFNIDANKG